MDTYPSIFNDVIGPVMRGPSSSHCAASLRIARLCRDLMDENIKDVMIEFDPDGSLATTHKSQGSDMGLFGGFMGWEAYDERLPQSDKHLAAAGINVTINICDIGADHPNTYKFTLSNNIETRNLTAISTGGGMIEVIEIDGNAVSIAGDYFETLIYCKESEKIIQYLKASISFDDIQFHKGEISFIEIKSQSFPDPSICDELLSMAEVTVIKFLKPILPVMARKNLQVPFITCHEMLEYNKNKNKSLWQLALDYEANRGNISEAEVFEKMRDIIHIMDKAIQLGLKGTHYEDRILGSQSVLFKEKLDSNQLIGGETNNRIIMYVSAMMEVKSSMGVIVAAPTAGSCGALPGAIFGTGHSLQLDEDEIVKAMLSAGLIGVFIAAHATFAAEVGGCMAETGSGGGMAAAAITEMNGGTLKQSIAAASLALQNSLGIICDPIGNRVEAPCLGRNVMAATNAVSCANMALSNYEHLIPLDEVIETMKAVGDQIHHTLRCTNLGGLSITNAAKKIEALLEEHPNKLYKSC
ncbi:L-serine ammonia-lyase, iron-sulfur-dependent, subunit alpha [Flavihumibacter fluvii]|uniref:L-serine ammonia-lyase, iron-sulfur-dependent, subunit alpha n=1 Tax=Flavihumibacter fluvii TaxID=2838157 RepID=UPI001BDE2C10|nr:L-serine ammonia-lyase, iron-sulfur-dependent, subunit alpha [Flavihumibacter fluvii]ULQ53063.1 L-serine ammonia-lyase, iron-sulfur-dependent, subunit alpha [Flavihumibacter fluvii]